LAVAFAAVVASFAGCSSASSSPAFLAAVERFGHQSAHISYRVTVPGDARFANGSVLTIDGDGASTSIQLHWVERGRGMHSTYVTTADGGVTSCGPTDEAVSTTSDCRVLLSPSSHSTTTFLLPTARVLAEDDELIDAERSTCWKLKSADVHTSTTSCFGDHDGVMLLMRGEGASEILSLMVSGWGNAPASAVESDAVLTAVQHSAQPAPGAFALPTPVP
jgi:hypothetical protein